MRKPPALTVTPSSPQQHHGFHWLTTISSLLFALILIHPNQVVVVEGIVQCYIIPSDFDRGFGCVVTPQECPNENVTFWLYTRETQNDPHELDLARPEETIRPEFFKQNAPLVVLIHGYTGHRDFSPNTEIRPAYLAAGDYNVISVDYGPLARVPCYFSAVRNLPTVANCTARLLDYMEENQVTDMGYYNVIGFSLGGQTSGMISRFKRGAMIPRLTALDPAKPCFIDVDKDYRLDDGDARFVNVIHTDVFMRGILSPIGHVDFYLNGGYNQPGCDDKNGEVGACNHDRAAVYYAESITSDRGFWGYRCKDWFAFMAGTCQERNDSYIQMGDRTPESARGSYFVSTNKLQPFAKGRLSDKGDVLEQFWSFIFPNY